MSERAQPIKTAAPCAIEAVPRTPSVSILVPCRNEQDHIENFLRDVLTQEAVPGDYEVLVIDGMSDDGTRELIQSAIELDRRVTLIDNHRRFVSAALNEGIRGARANVIVRMDVHSRYAPDYVSQCLAVLDETRADNVGGAARTEARGFWQTAIALAYASPFAVGRARFHFEDYEGEVDTVTYGCWRRDTLIRLGGFDEDLVRNQDDELNLRITRSGGKIWQSRRIKSWYSPRSSLRSLFKQYYQYGYWKVAVIRKHKCPASWRHLIPAAFVTSLLALAAASVVIQWSRLLLGLLLVTYLAFLFTGSARAVRRRDPALLPAVLLALATFHISYGLGFLHALVTGTRRAMTSASSLSR